jgi:hypothetical protein
MGKPQQSGGDTNKGLNIWNSINRTIVTMLVAVIGAAVTFIGYKMEDNRASSAEHDKAITAIRDSWVKQKELDLDLGVKMFQNMLNNFLQPGASLGKIEVRRQQMLLLKLTSLNFQDTPINLRALYEELDAKLTDPAEKEELRKIAMEVARRQAFRLTIQSGWDTGEISVKQGDEIPLREDMPFKIRINGIKDDQIFLSLIPLDPNRKPLDFSVDYFVMPIIDNTKLGVYRVSVMRMANDAANPTMPRMRIIVFDSYLAPDRFDIKEKTHDYEKENMGTTDITASQ